MCLLNLFQEMEGGWGTVDIAWAFLGTFLWGCSNMKKQGDHRNKILLINRCVKAVITLKGRNQDPLKLHVSLREFSTVEEKMGLQKGNFVWSRKITCIMCIGVSTPLSKAPPTLFRQAPFKSANCPSNAPLYIGFSWSPLKIRFFSGSPNIEISYP